MDSTKERLSLSEHWLELSPRDWSIIDYLIKLTEKNTETDKRAGHQKLGSDLKDLYVIYIDDASTKRKISLLQNQLKNPSSSISLFWDKHSLELRASSLENKVADSKFEISSNNKRKSSEGESSRNKRREPEDRLVRRESELATSDTSIIGLTIFRAYLEAMYHYPHMLTKPYTKKVTEYDFSRCIWILSLKPFFRLKTALSELKVMNRLTHLPLRKNQANNTKTDIGIGECALSDDDDKAIYYEGKLTKEGKNSLDDIINVIPEDIGYNTIWIIQIVDTHCILSTIHFQSSGLYVVMHRHSFNIPFSE